jgi:hypothetical protein
MRIKGTNGNVGIGTANPGYVLQVNSAATGSETVAAFLKPSMATGGTQALIQVGGAIATGGAGAMGFLNYGTNASNVFQLSLNGSGGSAININSTGVGIGTTNPSSALHVVGQTIGTFPVHLSLYGTPSYYNNSGTLLNPPATNTYVYLLWPSYGLTSQNWTPSYTTATKLGIPYTGLYAVKFALHSGAGTNPVFEMFISKNLCNGNDLNVLDDRLLALGYVGISELTLSATAYLSTTDFLNFGFYFASGTLTGSVAGPRCTVNVTLLQRTA